MYKMNPDYLLGYELMDTQHQYLFGLMEKAQSLLKDENILYKYDELIKQSNATMYAGWETVRVQVMRLETYLNDLGVDLRPCHNDAVPENFIKSEDGRIYLIDWEYSGSNDPMADFAALFLESNFSEENKDYVMKLYFQNEIPANTWEKIQCYQILWDYLWAQWTVIKEANGDNFGTYGFDRYNRAKTNLSKIRNSKND